MSEFINSFFGKEVRKKRQRPKQVKKESSDKKKQSNKSRRTKPDVDGVKPPPGAVFYKGYYFIDIKRSKTAGQRYDALFLNARTGKERRIAFGKVGEKDYITLQDNDQREFYDFKHQKKENWKDLMSRSALKKYILWNKGSLESSVRDYKRRLKGGR